MKLFHWNMSTALKEYAPGDIVVMAETIEEARYKARRAFREYLAQRFYYYDALDPEDQAYLQELRDKMSLDLKEIPLLVDSGVVFIRGSQ